MNRTCHIFCLVLCCYAATAQRKIDYTKIFQVSLTPAIGTNGMHPGGYINYFSFNLTSGYSMANYIFEIGLISNLNVNETKGLQISGIANLTGANAFAGMQQKEKDEKIKRGFEANLTGFQIAGVSNVVLNNVFGGQISGVTNVAKGALQGFQLSGISNVVYKYSFGVQAATVFNISYQSMDGIQLAGISNFTSGGLYGIQVAALNRAGFIEGKNSYDNHDATGLQLGLVNVSGKMNGFQVGLINFSKRMQGTMVGLVNIYRSGSIAQTRDGTAIGLINMGSSAYGALYANEWFFLNLEIATGTLKNGRIIEASKNIHIQNALIYSNYAIPDGEGKDPWALGYGLKKFYFNRSPTPGMNNFRFLSFGMDILQINGEKNKFNESLSLLMRPKISMGTKVHPKLRSLYIFAAASYSAYLTETDEIPAPVFLKSTASIGDKLLRMWPGVSVGLHIQ